MNMPKLAIQQEEGQNNTDQVHTHGYNLRERPIIQKEWISLAIAKADKSTGVAKESQYSKFYPKVHAQIMLTQMSIKQGQLDFGEKGNKD